MRQVFGRKLNLTALAILLIVCPITGHYINEVRIARHDTRSLVETALKRYGAELTITDLSPSRKSMLIAIEDPTFYHHHGVDLTTPGAGMTTITQGLVKLLYFPEGFRQGIAKIRQTLIAQYALDALVSKDEQMRLFLNSSYLGTVDNREIHGFQCAARVYFHKEFSTISDDEFLSLVAMLIGPNALKPGTEANTERVLRIKKYLSGQYKPAGLLDVDYNGKRHGTIAEEALMAFLRLITNARPEREL
ncbi:biosynthetic peptidoglycan transglycosylase [uncultured Desulfobacter sp.]|uniref:biosynthetic peptidoglycan transglycosylase n=1 Tax=uncultured Desulfobacter sp. TaxID=240139 RepID=UPI002AABA072|nr:biosynthetic peptidoglycan transglycosylase [uncultured Desulfobacter sp.]